MTVHFINGLKVVTSNIFPPIPLRKFDWCAYFDGEEEGLTGYGPTEADAIDDLMCQQDALGSGEAETEPLDHQTAAWDHARDRRKHS